MLREHKVERVLVLVAGSQQDRAVRIWKEKEEEEEEGGVVESVRKRRWELPVGAEQNCGHGPQF